MLGACSLSLFGEVLVGGREEESLHSYNSYCQVRRLHFAGCSVGRQGDVPLVGRGDASIRIASAKDSVDAGAIA